MKALVGAFNQEKALVGALSTIVKLSLWFICSSNIDSFLLEVHSQGGGGGVVLEADPLLDALLGGVLEVAALLIPPQLDLLVLEHGLRQGELHLLGDLAAVVHQLVLVRLGGGHINTDNIGITSFKSS